jgi:hypothetical protein
LDFGRALSRPFFLRGAFSQAAVTQFIQPRDNTKIALNDTLSPRLTKLKKPVDLRSSSAGIGQPKTQSHPHLRVFVPAQTRLGLPTPSPLGPIAL